VLSPSRLKVPHTFVLLFGLIVLCTVLTYLVPAGEFDRVKDERTGKTVVVAGTYKVVEQRPVDPFRMFVDIFKGMMDAGEVIFFVFVVYASFYTVLQTGALNSFLGFLIKKLEGRELLMIPIPMYLFALGGSVFGMFEEAMGFIPLFVGLALAVGYDAIVGLSMCMLGVGMGFAAAFMNPFTVGLAQKFAELPLFSGMGFRLVSWFTFTTMAVAWTMRYAASIKRDPSRSLMYGVDMGSLSLDREELKRAHFSLRDKLILALVVVSVGFLIWGVTQQGWYFEEMAALSMMMGVLAGLIGGFSPDRIAVTFLEGARDVVFGALVIGLSRGILMVMRDGQIIDTVIWATSQPLSYLPKWVAAEGMLLVQTLINFFIPSGSGQASTTMPIMAPLSDLLGIPRQVAVLAFQYGDGFSNLLWPTTLLPVICSIAKVPIERWWRFFTPFFILLFLVQMVFVAVAVLINYQ